MEKRNESLNMLLQDSTTLGFHFKQEPDKALIKTGSTVFSCSREDILTFKQSPARDALLDQMSNLQIGTHVVVGVFEQDDFLSQVVELKPLPR